MNLSNSKEYIEQIVAWLSSLSATSLFIYYLTYKKAKKLLKWIILFALIGAYFFYRLAGNVSLQ